MEAANHRLQMYNTMKNEEQVIHDKCMSRLGLSALEKDDNITTDLMVKCCQQILQYLPSVGQTCVDCDWRISHYYSVLQDGEMCIPWDWTSAVGKKQSRPPVDRVEIVFIFR
ncbi:DUF4461 domain-containing protein [Trichonephila clavata]|uniref:DUF4461 domain-containing protein n=1 Tax=Trichonephila clavata TaxID=2740835 RepID=A0A8X6H1P3_TRICU|nr:DUF4461 domain-containing protein [Trichonephila clavata]